MRQIPVASGIHAHSIIPTLQDGPLEDRNDGVVEYKSAHIDGVESELVIEHQDHSTQSNPLAVREVHRILLEQLGPCGNAVEAGPRSSEPGSCKATGASAERLPYRLAKLLAQAFASAGVSARTLGHGRMCWRPCSWNHRSELAARRSAMHSRRL